MLKTILVATDFSVAARRAVMRAALLAKESGARLHVLHALPERQLFDRLFGRNDIDHSAIAAGAQRALQIELDAIRSHPGIEAQSLLREGAAQRVITAAAEEIGASLLVIGAHGEREPSQRARMLGGTALKCFARTTLPLLLVRRDVVGNYYRILAAVDDSAGAIGVLAAVNEVGGSRSVCQAVHAFEAPFDARLRAHELKEATIAAYAAQERDKAERNLRSRLEGTRITPVVLRGNPAEVVAREVREREPDLIVIGKRRVLPDVDPDGRRYFGSVSLRVAFEADTDVLLVP